MEIKLDFIGIGAQKAGSTWLYKNLSQHPQVNINKKEINFFNDKFSFYSKRFGSNYDKGLDWYKLKLNIEENQLNGEITPNYLYDSKVPKRINKHFPKIKILVVLRNPIDRAYSQFDFANKVLHVGDDFLETIEKESEFIERSLYYKQLKRYYDLFDDKQIKVLFLHEIKKNPQKANSLLNLIVK